MSLSILKWTLDQGQGTEFHCFPDGLGGGLDDGGDCDGKVDDG